MPTVVILVLLFPATLGAVLPELTSADIRRALEMVRAREEDSLLEKYGRPYPFRAPQSVERIELATDFTRVLSRARVQRKLGNFYSHFQAVHDYRGEGRHFVEVIARISLSAAAIPSSSAFPFGSDYAITLFFTDPQGRPARRSYAGGQIARKLLCAGLECYQPSSAPITGADLRVLLPVVWLHPDSDLEVLVREPDGHSTAALFDLPELP